MTTRSPLSSMLAVAFAAQAQATSLEHFDDRMAQEAAAIIRSVMADARPIERCQFGEGWGMYPVPSASARRHLGLNLDADVSAASQPITLRQAVDPQGAWPSAFCDAAVEAKNTRENVERFERGGTGAMPPLRRWDFSFPVFDRRQRTAIVVVEHREHDGRVRLAAGKVIRKDNEIAVRALVFHKRVGRWRLSATVTLLMS